MPSSTAQKNVQAVLDGVTGNKDTGISGLVFAAIDKNGEYITTNASGKRGLSSDKPMDLDTVFWIASCTKVLATMACLQAVEQGELKLDDHKDLYKYCPELEKVQVLQEDGSLVKKKEEITLRMLLTHTAGFGYEFFNEKLRDYGRPTGYDVFRGTEDEILRAPLVNQPGSRWEYGINIDWAGLYLERATGTRLDTWLQKNVFAPCDVKDITFLPSSSMISNLATMHQRWPGSTAAHERDHLYAAPLLAKGDEEKSRLLQSGGAGCFARPSEYVKVLAMLLNDGVSPITKQKVLEKATVEDMFKNQIPHMPDYARVPIAAAKPEFTNPSQELYPQEGNPPQGWGMSFMQTIEPGATGRGANTCWWAGIANLFYWVDREKGVAGMIASQMLPFGDQHVMGAWFGAEKSVYDALGEK
ncbi:hypothetical protein MBLNU457_4740t1 [Dothideomycetes sp. NU457]